MEPTFNLIYEPWIQVLNLDGDSEVVSMLDAFKYAHRFRCLAGELPTQDVAVLRLLLAVMHAALAGRDVDGQPFPEGDEGKLIGSRKLWKDLWERGALPWERIEEYLKEYENRFYLFHPTAPFFQAVISGKATEYSAYKLNGELSESENKKRLFPQRSGAAKAELEYAEAARWLIYVNGYDDTAAKTGTGIGWLGKLGLVTAVGKNLFQTLMLNFILLREKGTKLWGTDPPIWEITPKDTVLKNMPAPNSPEGLYTFQFRSLLLNMGNEKKVNGFRIFDGSCFSEENVLVEPMTLWTIDEKKKEAFTNWIPKRHNQSVQFWRSFESLVVGGMSNKKPGIVGWLEYLLNHGFISDREVSFRALGTYYCPGQHSSIEGVFDDSISFSSALLHEGEQYEQWIDNIVETLKITQELVGVLGQLALETTLSQVGKIEEKDQKRIKEKKKGKEKDIGKEKANIAKSKEMEQAYFSLDLPFRQWLASIKPEDDDIEEQQDKWWNTAKLIVRKRGTYLARNAGQQAIVGRGDNNVPQAYNRFLWRTKNMENLTFKKGGKS
jgi:CRISPR system Cascade subunit CasA